MQENIISAIAPPQGYTKWEDLMSLALEEADKAAHLDEVPVGAIVVSEDGKIIGKGHNSPLSSCNPTAHAEIMAIQEAAQNLKNYRLIDAYLVVTLEPCLMCAGAIIHARLKGVIFGAADYKTGAISSQINAFSLPFHNHKPLWAGGVMQEECAQILSLFFQTKRGLSRSNQ